MTIKIKDPNDPLNYILIDEVSLYDIMGNIVGPDHPLPVVLPGEVCLDNSTSVPLDGDDVFEGEWQDTIDYGVVSIGIKADKDSATDGLQILWSADESTIHDTDVFTISAYAGKTFTFGPARRYVKIVYINGGEAQTLFNLETVLRRVYVKPSSHRIQDSIVDEDDAELVKAVIAGKNPGGDHVNFQATTAGNFKMSLEEFDKTFNDNPLPVTEEAKTAFGDLRVAELSPQFQASFEYTVDNSDLFEKSETEGGEVSQAAGMGIVATSTTTNSSAMLSSKRHARYKSGLGGVIRFTALFTSPVANTEQYVGLRDSMGSSAVFKNGYAIGYDGLTFGYHRFQNDSKITTVIEDWDDPLNGTGVSGATIDQTKLNVFFIQYQFLGAGAIKIFFEKQNGDIVLVHIDKYAGLFTEPSTHNPNFRFHMHVHNKGTTSNLIMKSSSFAYFIEGKTSFIELHQPVNSSGTVQKTGVTTEVAILTIRNKSNYASKVNFIDLVLEYMWASIEASSNNNLGSVRLVLNADIGGEPSYSDIHATNSVVEIDTSGTTVTGGREVFTSPLAGKNDKDRESLIPHKLILAPGETATIAGLSANSATIQAGILWRELF